LNRRGVPPAVGTGGCGRGKPFATRALADAFLGTLMTPRAMAGSLTRRPGCPPG
jgi:hypothetical protein